MKRLIILAISVMAAAGAMGGFHEWTPPAHAASGAPAKLAIVVLENHRYTQMEKTNGTNPLVTAPYINGNNFEGIGESIVPTPKACDYPTADGAGSTGTLACTSGMFNAYRTNASPSYRLKGSAPEYAFLSMASDANVRDGKFPFSTGATGINSNIVGYTPNTACTPISGTNGECASGSTYNVFDYMDAHSVTWKAYAEDYGGNGSTCSTATFNPANTSNFYARRHVAPMETWDIVPDAKKIGPTASAPQPDGSSCKSHVLDFPNNTPGSSTAVVTNFDGTQTFPTVTYIFPSMCHMGHNDNGTCGGTTTDFRGGVRGIDHWLEVNMPGIQKSVGQTGAVIVTFDEAGGSSVDGLGKAAPMPTWIIPGTDGSGVPGTLSDCIGTTFCQDSTHTYDVTSVAKTVMQYAGGTCSNFDNTVTYQGQPGTAQSLCTAATALPINTESVNPPDGPTIVNDVPGNNGSATGSVSASWDSVSSGYAAASGNLLVAALSCKGTCGTITGPTGWTLGPSQGNTSQIWYSLPSASSTARTGNQTWTFTVGETHRALVDMAEVGNVSGSMTLDTTNKATSGSVSTDTTALSGTIAATAQASELVFSAYMTNLGGIFNPPDSTCNTTPWDEISQNQQGDFVDLQFNWVILTATDDACSQSDFDEATTWRGVIAAFKN